MVKFEVSAVQKGMIEIYKLYAIYGDGENGQTKLLIVGSSSNAEEVEVPVIDITKSDQPSRHYYEDTCAADVCEDFGIDPQTAHYIDDYDDFELTFHYDEKED